MDVDGDLGSCAELRPSVCVQPVPSTAYGRSVIRNAPCGEVNNFLDSSIGGESILPSSQFLPKFTPSLYMLPPHLINTLHAVRTLEHACLLYQLRLAFSPNYGPTLKESTQFFKGPAHSCTQEGHKNSTHRKDTKSPTNHVDTPRGEKLEPHSEKREKRSRRKYTMA